MPNRTSTIESRTAFFTGSKLLACIGLMLALFACAFFAQPQQAFAAYPDASEVYVSGKQVSEIPSSAATYDASTGTLTLYKQANGVSVKSTRTKLDLNIVVEGDVTVYARSKHDYLLPNLYGISNDTGGDISINVTENSKLSVNVVIADDAAPPEVSITEFGGIWCKGRVTLTGEEGSNFSVYARSDWYKVTGGKSELQSLSNLPTTGIRANGGLYINGALSGKIQVQNHGATATLNYCTSAVRVTSGAQVNVGGTGDWTFDTSSCWYKGDNADQFNALFYVNMGSIRPNIADSVGKVKFSKTDRENSYFALAGTGNATPTWSMAFSDLPEINYHVLTVGAQNAEYAKDSRAIINSTTIKLTEVPALGTPATLTSDNTELDVGQSQPRYTVNYGEGHWWYKKPGKDYWITLGNTEDLPADATAVRVSFVLEANEDYRIAYGTNVRVQLPNGTTRDTTERNYMHPASNPSKGSFYIDLQLSDIAEQHLIDRVKIWGLSSPYMGREAWTESGTTNTTSSSALISGSHYTRYEWATGDQLTSNGYQYNQYWTLANDDGTDTNNRVPSGSQFQAGKKYFWHGVLHAKTGWKFTYETLRDLDGAIAAPKWVSTDGKVMEVTKGFQCPTRAINKVEAIDQTEPVAGQTAAIDATVPDDANYSIDTGRSHWVEGVLDASTYWTDADTPFTGTFEANKFYTLVMFIEPDRANGCGFPFTNDNQLIWDKDDATINGEGYEYGYYFAEGTNDGRGSLMVFRVFWCNDPDAITHINIQQTMPVAGQVAVSDAVSLTPDVTLDAVGAEQKERFTSLNSNFDVSRISDDATSVWIGNLFNEDESFNYAALMPTFEYSEAGIDRTYIFNARAIAADGKTFARDEAGATVKVFVGGLPASVQVTSDEPDVANIRLPYTMSWANSDTLKLFVPCGVQLQVELEDGSWTSWSPSVADYENTGFDCYDQATAGKRFRVYPTYKWQAPTGEEFYKWYSSTGDVEFQNNVREEYNYFTMPDHDVTVDILTQKEGTLPTDLEDVTISGYTASDGWNSPNDYSYTTFNGHDQWREAVLVDTKGTSETDDDYTLVKGTDYTVSYEPVMGSNKGDYEVTYTGIPGSGNEGGYEGTRITNYTIFTRAIEDCDVTLNTTYVEDPVNPGDDPIYWEYYTGEEIKPSVTVKLGDVELTEGTDYEVKYFWNTDVGSATVEITTAGIDGNFHSWTCCYFEIRGHDINDADVAAIPDETFDFNYHTPDLEITYAGSTLQENTDYTVTYTDNIDAGTATATIKGLASTGWTGTREVTFKINPLDLDDKEITWYGDHARSYTGSAITTSEVWGEYNHRSINLGTEIQCEYSDNVYPGVATMTMKPLSSNFTGSHDVHFDIQVALNSGYMSYSGVETSYPYTGSQITTPEPVVKIGDKTLTKDKDYKLSYGENIEAGGATGSVTVEPYDEDHYYNSKTLYFDIAPADISSATITDIPDQAYDDGNAVEPKPTVKIGDKTLEPDSDYYLTYVNNYEIGEATVTVHGTGNYTGEISATFNIVEPEPLRLGYASGVEGSTSWQDWVYDGELSGTVGKSLRMEGLKMRIEGTLPKGCSSGGIRYQAQLQSDGWQTWKEDGQVAGYDPKKSGGKRLEAVKIELTGDLANHYDVWYHLQVQRFGWMGWVKNGQVSGTVGYAFRVEAIEAVLLPKGSEAPTIGHNVATSESNMLSFVRCRSYDNKVWQGAKGEGDVSGTRKQTKTCIRVGLAASSFSAAGIEKGDSYIQVRVYQGGKWSSWSTADDAEVGAKNGKAITGVQARLYPGSTLTADYDLYYRVEVKDGSGKACWLGWAKEGETAGQSNLNLEQLEFSLVPKGEAAPPASASELQDTIAHVKQRWVIERWPCNWPKPAYRFK